jgi:hypothetical protein
VSIAESLFPAILIPPSSLVAASFNENTVFKPLVVVVIPVLAL